MARGQQRLKLDGIPVMHERAASFAGGFDVDEADIEALAYDEMVVAVVVARVGVPSFKETSSGEIQRTDKLELGKTPQVRIVTNPETAEEIADMFGLDATGGRFQFEGDVPRHDEEPDEAEEEPEPEPEPEPVKATKKKAPAKKATAKKAAKTPKKAAAAAARPVAPMSGIVGQHVGGANAHDEALNDFFGEDAQFVAGG